MIFKLASSFVHVYIFFAVALIHMKIFSSPGFLGVVAALAF